jgi:hypothetical protein
MSYWQTEIQMQTNNKRRLFFITELLCCCMLLANTAEAQKTGKDTIKQKPVLRDTLDNKLDFSGFLNDPKGFIPVPMIVTEPALGGFGGLLIPMFIKPVKGLPGTYSPPDITAFPAMYTANKSWLVGAFRMGSIPKWSMKYRVGIAYADINLSFYRTLPNIGDKEFKFNIEALPVLLSLSKKINKKEVYLGVQYTYSHTKVAARFTDSLPAFVDKAKALDSKTGSLGVFVDWDKRNSIFTADKGARINILYTADAQWTGSDYNYQRTNASVNWFVPVKKNWISGVRGEVQHVFDEPPFYLLPYISLRGVPAARYQGVTTVILETEQRFDMNLRWSLLGFAGLAKAIERKQSFGEASYVYNVGTGFRYLIARAFKIRAGVDIARGPEEFGYYIVFGHNWNR